MTERAAKHAGARGAGSRSPHPLWIALVFVALSLLALLFVPLHHARQVEELENQLIEVLEPARRLGFRLALAQTEQMAALQGFVLSGEGAFRQDYRRARRTEEAVYDSLYALSEEMDLALRGQMVQLWSLSLAWHVAHEGIVEGELSASDFRSTLADEQRSYQEVVALSHQLQEDITAQFEAGRARIEESRTRQMALTVGLVLLAFAATVAVGFLGYTLIMLYREGERRREEAVAARREIDAVLSATADGVAGLDPEGRLTSLNPAGEALLGLQAHRGLGRTIHDLIHQTRPDGEEHPEGECPIVRTLKHAEARTLSEEILWRSDGTSFPAQISIRPLVNGRRIQGAVLTFTDLTDLRKKEQQLRRAVEARDEVVAVVSHDLRNPLSTILAAVELVLDLDLEPEKERAQLEAVRRSAERMKCLLEDLLDVASMEAGVLSVDLRTVDPGRLVEEAREMATTVIRAAGLSLSVVVQEGLPRVAADPDRVLQVFSNLVSNAVRYTPRGELISIEAERGVQEVIFSVEDSGPGVPEKDRARLFDRFWKVDRHEREGAGLGLAIVKGIVESHRGRVWIGEGREGGARFSFALPIAADRSRSSPASPGLFAVEKADTLTEL